MTKIITALALALAPASHPLPVLTVPFSGPVQPQGPAFVPSAPFTPAGDVNAAIDKWLADTARWDDAVLLDRWLAWEREQWFAAEAANAARAAAYRPPPPATWVHGWITDAMLWELRQCESTNNYQVNTGNGFFGAVQWLRHTWDSAAAGAGRDDLVGVRPDLVAPADQDYVTKYWWSVSDYRGQWPVCGPRAVARAG